MAAGQARKAASRRPSFRMHHTALEFLTGARYFPAAMLRQLLAFLALVTGFAALDAPAQAAVANAASVTLERVDASEHAARRDETVCARRQAKQRRSGEASAPCKGQRPITIYLPSVHLGPDRARE